MKLKTLFIFGTRPEAIKLAPVIKEFKDHSQIFETAVCVTAQHREMLDQVLDFFKIRPDFDLDGMRNHQSLSAMTSWMTKELERVIDFFKPQLIFVQGDTTTAFCGALSGFYKNVKIAHVEAGLRSDNKFAPFPEEINRILTDRLADFHFAPTVTAQRNLIKEGISTNIWVTGNTVIDSLFATLKMIDNKDCEKKIVDFFKDRIPDFLPLISPGKKLLLVTGHRRESFGWKFENICLAIKQIAREGANISIIYPVHLNPNVRRPVYQILSGLPNVYLIEPLEYAHLVWLMKKSYLILTDSGGIQEEAPSLGKPVLIMRDVTERPEGVEAGTAKLVGTDIEDIFQSTMSLIRSREDYERMAKAKNPYGDGKSSRRIVKCIKEIHAGRSLHPYHHSSHLS